MVPAYRRLWFEPCLTRKEIESSISDVDLSDDDQAIEQFWEWVVADAEGSYLDMYAAREVILRALLNPVGRDRFYMIIVYASNMPSWSPKDDFEFAAALCEDAFGILCRHSRYELDIEQSEEYKYVFHSHHVTWTMHEWANCLHVLGKEREREELYERYRNESRRLYPDYPSEWDHAICRFNRVLVRYRAMTPDVTDDELTEMMNELDAIATSPGTSPGYIEKASGTRGFIKKMIERRTSARAA